MSAPKKRYVDASELDALEHARDVLTPNLRAELDAAHAREVALREAFETVRGVNADQVRRLSAAITELAGVRDVVAILEREIKTIKSAGSTVEELRARVRTLEADALVAARAVQELGRSRLAARCDELAARCRALEAACAANKPAPRTTEGSAA